MKIVVTGSLGHVGKFLATKLVRAGHAVTVISSNPEKKAAIEGIGAGAAIGKLADADFLASTFTGADAVYCMIPISFKEADQVAYFRKIGNSYALAIRKAGVKRVVLLSGWVAGIIRPYQEIEDIFNHLKDVSVTHIRPGYFYSNFFEAVQMIKEKDVIAATFGGEDRIVFSAPSDIADAAADELTRPRDGRRVRYLASDEMTCNEAANILGAAIGKPDLKWTAVTGEEMRRRLETSGLSSKLASDIVEMQEPIHKGLMTDEFARHRSEVINGKLKLADFAKEFAELFSEQ